MKDPPPQPRLPSTRGLCGKSETLTLRHGFGPTPVAGYLEGDLSAAITAQRHALDIAICSEDGLVQQAYRDAVTFQHVSFFSVSSMTKALAAAELVPIDIKSAVLAFNDCCTHDLSNFEGLRAIPL